jgi:hypothetical protein
MLGLEHEDKVIASRRVVNWYNGSLDNDLDLDLSNRRDLIVIGNGNIFCDISRILLKGGEALSESDIPLGVIEQLKASNI